MNAVINTFKPMPDDYLGTAQEYYYQQLMSLLLDASLTPMELITIHLMVERTMLNTQQANALRLARRRLEVRENGVEPWLLTQIRNNSLL